MKTCGNTTLFVKSEGSLLGNSTKNCQMAKNLLFNFMCFYTVFLDFPELLIDNRDNLTEASHSTNLCADK